MDIATSTAPRPATPEKHDAAEQILPAPAEGLAEAVVAIEGAQVSTPPVDSHGKQKPKADSTPGLGNFFRVLGYATPLDRFLMVAGVICSGGAGVALPLMNIIFGHLVGSFNNYFIPGSTVTTDQFLSGVNSNALYFFYLFIGKFILGYIAIYCFRMTGIRISASIRMAYLVALFNQPISVIDKLPPGAATDSLTTVANTIQIGISDKLAILVQSLALILSAYVIAFKYSWALTLVSSSTILFVFMVYGTIVPFFMKIENAVNESNSGASAVAGEVLKSVRTVKSLCAENAVTARYALWIAQARERGLARSPWSGALFSPAYFAIYANMALTFWFGVKLYSQNDIPNVSTVVV